MSTANNFSGNPTNQDQSLHARLLVADLHDLSVLLFQLLYGFVRRIRNRTQSVKVNGLVITQESIGVSIWESHITLGNHKYRGTVEEFGTMDPSRVHEEESK